MLKRGGGNEETSLCWCLDIMKEMKLGVKVASKHI